MSKFSHYWYFRIGLLFLLAFFAGFVVKGYDVFGEMVSPLYVSPTTGNLLINGENSTTIEIIVENISDLQGFDITIAYDPAIVRLDSWELGNAVSMFDKIFEEHRSKDGLQEVQLAHFKIGDSINIDTGVLLQFTFSGLSAGNSPILIVNAELSNPKGEFMDLTLGHGSLTVGYHTAPVTGAVVLQGQARRSGVPVSLGTGTFYMQGPFDALSLPVLGANLDFGAVVSGDTYTLTTNQPRYLNLVRTLTVNDPLTLPPLRLLAGDVVGDNTIATADLDAVRAAFGAIGPGLAADLNADGVVDLRDLALVGGNFGLSSLEAYADWLP